MTIELRRTLQNTSAEGVFMRKRGAIILLTGLVLALAVDAAFAFR
jgi:hypothetical protein